jgi:CRISPR-associated protein Csm4
MKVYEAWIKPTSDFATPLQGDSLFGQICWQIAHDDSLAGGIDGLLSNYDSNPFCVVSDPVMRFETNDGTIEYVLPKPFCPNKRTEVNALATREQEGLDYDKRKKVKKAKWIRLSKEEKLSNVDDMELMDLDEIRFRYGLDADWQAFIDYRQSHNSIDRFTGTTGTGGQFAPFALNCLSYNPELILSVFIGIRDGLDVAGIETALRRIGSFGYGADATSGKGRFEVLGELREIDLQGLGNKAGNAYYSLAALVPEKEKYEKIFFEPFVRFGRHGGSRAISGNPFKQPVLKAAAGAVLVLKDGVEATEKFVGLGVKNLSTYKDTVEQGYSLVIPMKVEVLT